VNISLQDNFEVPIYIDISTGMSVLIVHCKSLHAPLTGVSFGTIFLVF